MNIPEYSGKIQHFSSQLNVCFHVKRSEVKYLDTEKTLKNPRNSAYVYDIQFIYKPWSIEATICFKHFLSYQNEHNCGSRRRRDRIRFHHFQEMVSKTGFRILNPPVGTRLRIRHHKIYVANLLS